MQKRLTSLNSELTEVLSNAIKSRGLGAPDLALRMGIGEKQVVDWLKSPVHTPLCHLSKMVAELRVVEEFMTTINMHQFKQLN